MKRQLLSLLLLYLGVTDFAYANTNKDSLDRLSVKNTLQKTVEWQINHFQYSTEGSPGHLHDYGINAWTNAVLYAGMTEWIKIAGENDSTLNWLQDIGEKSHWAIAENFSQSRYGLYHADELCIGQFFLEMYGKYKDEEMLKSTKNRLDWIIANPPDTSLLAKNKQSWTWCDALFMAPPVYARMAALTQDDKYLQFMDKQFKNTYFHLYNKAEKLFFRDDSYFDKREENNRNVFWGRGNGWVAAGLVNILKQLPDHSPYRPFYENLFREFVPQLVALQDKSGYWHASLLDPESYPSPETSATALITYALAYGINSGLLDKNDFLPAVLQSWKALSNAVDEAGKIGWIQPIGADPRKVTADATAVYGVGAFLMAGYEIYKLAE